MTIQEHIQRHLAFKRWNHDQGECASIQCPWCEFDREHKTGRFSPPGGFKPSDYVGSGFRPEPDSLDARDALKRETL